MSSNVILCLLLSGITAPAGLLPAIGYRVLAMKVIFLLLKPKAGISQHLMQFMTACWRFIDGAKEFQFPSEKSSRYSYLSSSKKCFL
jgi:hypothetical protein